MYFFFDSKKKPINSVLGDKIHKNKYENLEIDDEDVKYLEEIIRVLQFFYEATLLFSGEKYVTLSLVLPTFRSLLSNMSENIEDSEITKTLKAFLHEQTFHYMDKYININEDLYVTATFLDVCVKFFRGADQNAIKTYYKIAENKMKEICKNGPDHIKERLKNTSNNTTKNDLKSGLLQIYDIDKNISNSKKNAKLAGFAKEISEYISEPPKLIEPIEFWKQNKDAYPCLFYCFVIISSIPGTSVPSERLFSVSGNDISDRRNRLSPEKVDKILIIHNNEL